MPKGLKMNAGKISHFYHRNAQKHSLLRKVGVNCLPVIRLLDISNMPEFIFKQFGTHS